MKHLWFGTGLLAALLVISLCLGGALEETHHIPAKDLEKAAEAALDENWALASALFNRAENHWQKHRNLTAALTRHDPIELIDSGFATLEVYTACRDKTAFCAACVQLAQNLRALPQPHSFNWWNFL